MADKNTISRPVSMFWKKCTLLILHGGMLAESFPCRVVACCFSEKNVQVSRNISYFADRKKKFTLSLYCLLK